MTGEGGTGRALAFGDAQTGQLDQANGRADDVIEAVDACSSAQKRVLEALEPRPWWRWWGD